MARRGSPKSFERVIELAIAAVQPPEIQRLHASIARKGLADHLAARGGTPPHVRRIVDGRVGAAEETVKPYGVIRYEFDRMRDGALFALERLRALSPEDTGAYKTSWFLLYKGKEIEPEALPEDATEVVVINDKPYSRRLAVGRRADGRPFSLKNVPPGYIELARVAVTQRYGNSLRINASFLLLDGGYILRADYLVPGRRRARPQDRAGEPITYPALRLTLR